MSKKKLVHSFSERSVTGYFYCIRCGLVPLKNEATRKAIKAGCTSEVEGSRGKLKNIDWIDA